MSCWKPAAPFSQAIADLFLQAVKLPDVYKTAATAENQAAGWGGTLRFAESMQVWAHGAASTCKSSTTVPPEVSAFAWWANQHGYLSSLGTALRCGKQRRCAGAQLTVQVQQQWPGTAVLHRVVLHCT